jgi:hypothetical protein
MRVSELESGGEKAARDDLTALEDEFGFGAHEEANGHLLM